jgi:vacuolar-type H+-ATPase subunit B/Vma2
VIVLRKKDVEATELSEHDRKVLSKYTKFYTNFIESNTSKNTALKNKNFDGDTKRV